VDSDNIHETVRKRHIFTKQNAHHKSGTDFIMHHKRRLDSDSKAGGRSPVAYFERPKLPKARGGSVVVGSPLSGIASQQPNCDANVHVTDSSAMTNACIHMHHDQRQHDCSVHGTGRHDIGLVWEYWRAFGAVAQRIELERRDGVKEDQEAQTFGGKDEIFGGKDECRGGKDENRGGKEEDYDFGVKDLANNLSTGPNLEETSWAAEPTGHPDYGNPGCIRPGVLHETAVTCEECWDDEKCEFWAWDWFMCCFCPLDSRCERVCV
jgi:hypothetical protein